LFSIWLGRTASREGTLRQEAGHVLQAVLELVRLSILEHLALL
jgi:hypothetical protein